MSEEMCTPDPTPKSCQLHFGFSPDGRYGTLIDPNGHKWNICSECISSLWEVKHPYNQPDNQGSEVESEILVTLRIEWPRHEDWPTDNLMVIFGKPFYLMGSEGKYTLYLQTRPINADID